MHPIIFGKVLAVFSKPVIPVVLFQSSFFFPKLSQTVRVGIICFFKSLYLREQLCFQCFIEGGCRAFGFIIQTLNDMESVDNDNDVWVHISRSSKERPTHVHGHGLHLVEVIHLPEELGNVFCFRTRFFKCYNAGLVCLFCRFSIIGSQIFQFGC